MAKSSRCYSCQIYCPPRFIHYYICLEKAAQLSNGCSFAKFNFCHSSWHKNVWSAKTLAIGSPNAWQRRKGFGKLCVCYSGTLQVRPSVAKPWPVFRGGPISEFHSFATFVSLCETGLHWRFQYTYATQNQISPAKGQRSIRSGH